MAAAKHELRLWSRSVRDSIPDDVASRAAHSAAHRLLSHPLVERAAVIALYAPVQSELDTVPIHRVLAERGVALAYPRILPRERRLAFHRIREVSELSPGTLRIPEPDPSAPTVPTERIDLFLVPGLAFDRAGGRLGWGKGYYDATLAANRHGARVGYAFERLVVDAVPRSEWDAAMSHIVTEAGIRVCNRPPEE